MPIQRAFIPYLSQALTAETGLMKRPVSQNSLSGNRGEGLQKWKTGKRGKILVRGMKRYKLPLTLFLTKHLRYPETRSGR